MPSLFQELILDFVSRSFISYIYQVDIIFSYAYQNLLLLSFFVCSGITKVFGVRKSTDALGFYM